MPLPLPYCLKRFLRTVDGAVARKKCSVQFRGNHFEFLSTYWWPDATQEIFDSEIAPYFEALGNFQPTAILDVGAATGHFSVLAGHIFPRASITAFEPSQRQRVILQRNAKLNGVNIDRIEPIGLWNCADELPFRSVGAESSIAEVSRFKGQLDFPEKIPVVSLDQWVREKSVSSLDLIKMDAEGAEIEILEGARETLTRFHPHLLIQAYHLRDGVRTFERCAQMVAGHGYEVTEFGAQTGLLYAK